VVRFCSTGYKGFPAPARDPRRVKKDLLIHPAWRRCLARRRMWLRLPCMSCRATRSNSYVIGHRCAVPTGERIGQARRIVLLADSPAQPAAYNLIYFSSRWFQQLPCPPGVDDLARTVHTAPPKICSLRWMLPGITLYCQALTRRVIKIFLLPPSSAPPRCLHRGQPALSGGAFASVARYRNDCRGAIIYALRKHYAGISRPALPVQSKPLANFRSVFSSRVNDRR